MTNANYSKVRPNHPISPEGRGGKNDVRVGTPEPKKGKPTAKPSNRVTSDSGDEAMA